MAELRSSDVLSRFSNRLGICKFTLSSAAIAPTSLEEERSVEVETQVDSEIQQGSGGTLYWLTGSATIKLDGLYVVNNIVATSEEEFYCVAASEVVGTKTCLTVMVRSLRNTNYYPTVKNVMVTVSYTKTPVETHTDWQSLYFSDEVFNKYALQGVRCYIEDVEGYFEPTGFDSLWDYTPINVRDVVTYQLINNPTTRWKIKLHMDWVNLRYKFEYDPAIPNKILEWQSKTKELVFILYPYCSKNF